MYLLLQNRASSDLVLNLAAAAVWALAAASVAYWFLHWPKAEMAFSASADASSNQETASLYVPMARALGQTATQAASPAQPPSSHHILTGVIASASGQGSALIATDGQPAKAYRVGQTVQEGWMLMSLTARQARLKSAGTEVLLELPASAEP